MTDKTKKTPHQILHESLMPPLKDLSEKTTIQETSTVEKQSEETVENKKESVGDLLLKDGWFDPSKALAGVSQQKFEPKKGNMRRGKK